MFPFVILCRHFPLLSFYLPGLNNKTDDLWVDAFLPSTLSDNDKLRGEGILQEMSLI